LSDADAAPAPANAAPEESGAPFGGTAGPILAPVLVASAAAAAVELLGIGAGAGAASAEVLGMFLTAGAAIAAGWWLCVRVGAAVRPGWAAAAARGAGVLPPAALAARHLFDGAFAATLPAAGLGFLWVPLGAWALAALAARHLDRPPRHRHAAALALLGAAVGLALVDRQVKRSELPDVHAALLLATITLAALALRVSWPRRLRLSGTRRLVLATGTAAVVAVTLLHGFAEAEVRKLTATRSFHLRLLLRTARSLVDLDSDGFSPLLAGPDCDDRDPAIHPEAPDPPGDGLDQDCDGADAPSVVPPPAPPPAARAWGSDPATVAALARTRDMNILLLAVDTLRADAVRDADPAGLPAIAALQREGRTFTRAFSPSAGTDLSMSGVLTGLRNPFAGPEVTLAEALASGGRSTYAVIPSEVLRYVGRALLTRGFDEWRRLLNDGHTVDVGDYTTSQRTVDLGLELLTEHRARRPDRRWFLWLHFFDVHEHDELGNGDRHLREVLPDPRKATRQDKYRAVVQIVDQQLARVRRELEAAGEWERTIVIFVADHGEGLGDDPRLPVNHGLVVYQPLVHIPFVVRVPGESAAAIDVPVTLLDVTPTVLQLAGAPPAPRSDGLSLAPLLLGPPAPEVFPAQRPIPLHESEQVGVVRWPWKLLLRPADDLVELYDLEQDPGELQDRAATEPERVRELRAALRALPPVDLDRTARGRWRREAAAKAAAPTPDAS
jgi:arylsulfatase A-like enzyme